MKSLLVLLVVVCVAYALPPTNRDAKACSLSECLIENDCRCSSAPNPIASKDDPAPQLIAITVSESIVATLYSNYLEPLLFDRTNPDGLPIGATFYVNHEYTDYQLVQDLYLRGYEIGVHSITKNSSQEYWRNATLDDLVDEFGGQRQIISTFADIPIEDIIGGRTPQLQLEGDISIEAYTQSGLTYDNSWPARSANLILPYTLDYASNQQCVVTMTCPKEAHEHFWIAPITNIKGNSSVECNSLATCLIQGTAEEISAWLVDQVDNVENDKRVPIVLRLDSYWFNFIDNSFDGFTLFLDEMASRDDVFFVSVQNIIDWVRNPVPVSKYVTPYIDDRDAECNPVHCKFTLDDLSERYMTSCVPCPQAYPWKGNPLGE